MNKSQRNFTVGDFVFAKVSGYPHWPAKIAARKTNGYQVVFYGGLERAICTADKIKPYNDDTKKLYVKYPCSSRKDFIESIRQIGEALKGRVDQAAAEIKRRAQLKLKKKRKTTVTEPAAKPKIKKEVCDVNVPTTLKRKRDISESSSGAPQSEDSVESSEASEPKKSRVEDDLIQDLTQEYFNIQDLLTETVNIACDSLGFDAAYPYMALKCLDLIEKILEKVQNQKTMLLRNPQLFSSMVQLSKHQDATSSEARFGKNFNKQQMKEFDGKALRIREIAGAIVERFKKLFPELQQEPTAAFAKAFIEESNKN